jgi:hypothetical protein
MYTKNRFDLVVSYSLTVSNLTIAVQLNGTTLLNSTYTETMLLVYMVYF